MKKIAYLLAATVFSSFQATFAAEPAGYYAACENQGGKSLLEALHATISILYRNINEKELREKLASIQERRVEVNKLTALWKGRRKNEKKTDS